MSIFQLHAYIQQEATAERELVDHELKARKARRRTEHRSATPEEQEEERIMKAYRPSTVDEALTRVRNRIAEIDHERGIGGNLAIGGLEPRMNPDRWRQGDPDDIRAYSEAFERRQKALQARREWEENRPEAIKRRQELEMYNAILAKLKKQKRK
jgi:hypothetical protein